MKRQKGQILPRLERITVPLSATLSPPDNHHKPSNNVAYRVVWCALECAVVQGCLSRLMKRYIGLFSTCIDALSWPFNLGVGAISQGG